MTNSICGYVFYPRKLEFLLDADEMIAGNCAGDVYQEALARLTPDLAHMPHHIFSSRRPLTPQSRLGGLAATTSQGLVEVELPENTMDIVHNHPKRDKVYIPRDCEILFVQTGRTCLGLITSSPKFLQSSRHFETLDIA